MKITEAILERFIFHWNNEHGTILSRKEAILKLKEVLIAEDLRIVSGNDFLDIN